MRLITFLPPGGPACGGWLDGSHVMAARAAWDWLRQRDGSPAEPCPVGTGRMEGLISAPPGFLREFRDSLGGQKPTGVAWPVAAVRLMAPLPRPRTIRDFYAFEAHVRNARARRGLGMIEEWYRFPVFYFSNPNAVFGPGDEVPGPADTRMLDFELEVAAVLGRSGRNIRAEEAGEYIAGYMIMNDWSARDLQREEMKVGLGPAKGKDFATSLGPWLVTPDELPSDLSLTMTARINGREVSRGNLGDLHFSFGQMLERASRDCTLYPGEVIGSGTVGTGCLLETEAVPWLQPGDLVELEVEGLGLLRNTVGEPLP